jgi:hypothetical protein
LAHRIAVDYAEHKLSPHVWQLVMLGQCVAPPTCLRITNDPWQS